MNQKTLIILVLGLVMSFMLVIFAGFAVYSYFPTWIGLPPNKTTKVKVVKKDTVYVEPALYITKAKFDKLQQGVFEKGLYKLQRDQYYNYNQKLNDSINKLSKNISFWRDSASKVINKADDSKKPMAMLSDSLSKVKVLYQNALAEIEANKKQKAELEKLFTKKTDSLAEANFLSFAKIYDKTSPADVAKILDQIEPRDAALILKTMNKKKSAKILESMKPEKSAAILLLGGNAK
jgi:flagellar motility protein MotE (MotC chaperone)